MSPIASRLASVTLWVVPVAILAAVIGLETDWGRALRPALPADAPVSPAPVTAAILPGTSLVGGLDTLSATVERPLFNATRKPAPPAIVEAPKATIQRGQFTLTGTLVTDKAAIAFLRETGGAGKARSVRKGESINGMTVAEVAPDRVRFTMGDDSEELELKVAKGPKTTVQPAAEGASQAPQQGAAPQAAPIGQGDAAGVRRAAQGGLAGPGDAGDNLRANRRAARAAEAQQGGGQQGVTPAQTQQNRQQRRQQQAR